MLPKQTTHNSLNSYFEMADSANSSADVPVSSALPAPTSTSGSQANVPHNSSSSPALSVETLTASIVGALRPLFASARTNQLQSLPSTNQLQSLPSTSLTISSNLPLVVSSLLVVSSSAPHLPSAVQTPSTGRPIFVLSFINTFTAPAMSSRILPSSLSTLSPSIAPAMSNVLFLIHSAYPPTTIYCWAGFFACPVQIGFSDHLRQIHRPC